MAEHEPRYSEIEIDPTIRKGRERVRLDIEQEPERIPCLAFTDWDCQGSDSCPLFPTALNAAQAGSHISMIVGRNLADSGGLSPCPQYPASL